MLFLVNNSIKSFVLCCFFFVARLIQAKLTVTRSDPPPIAEIDIEITKKPGKEIGFNFIESQEQGILVTEIVSSIQLICKNCIRI